MRIRRVSYFITDGFAKLLGAGKYPLFGAREIEISLKEPLISAKCELDTLLANSEVAKLTSVCEVADQQLALHYTSGKFDGVLRRGKYAFWSVLERHEYQLVDISTPEVAEDVPQYIFAKLPTTVYTKVEVAQYQKARLYFDQKLIRILDAGTYYFWKNNIRVDVNLVDTRLTRMEITGQEIMTQDKVGLRINFVCNYRITDYVKILTEIDDYAGQMHVAAQLALRDFVGKQKLDDILANKDELSRYAFERLKARKRVLRGNYRRGREGYHSSRRDPRHHEYSADRGKAGTGQRHHPPGRGRPPPALAVTPQS